MARVFISYKHVEPDQTLARQLAAALAQGHTVFIDTQIPVGSIWANVIDENLDNADFMVAWVSRQSAESPMVVDDEIARAHELNLQRKRPSIIPIRLNFDEELPSPLRGYVNRFQQARWHGPGDTQHIIDLILAALEVPLAKSRPADQRQLMIDRVRADWVAGVLDKSLYRVARIDLGLQAEPGAVERGIDALIQRPDQDPQPLPAGTRLLDVFNQELGRMLILGAPGSGKTTLLLELARDLLDRAEKEVCQPIPVVFNLSSWAQKRKPLAKWMVGELQGRSDIPPKLGREWISNDQVLPLLDGLDEVAADYRQQCVEAINSYRDERPSVDMVVCSRVGEYEALTTRLRLRAAVVVEPLSAAHVRGYLDTAGKPLESVRKALEADGQLWELLSTPLMLSIVALAYNDQLVEAIPAGKGSLEDRRQQVFGAYVKQMFRRRTKETHFKEDDVRNWLSFMASRMIATAQTTFQIEDIRSRWTGRRSVTIIATVSVVLVAATLSGVLGTIGFYALWPVSLTTPSGLRRLLSLLTGTALIGALLALIRSRAASPVEFLQLRWPGVKIFLLETVKWAALGGALGSILGAAWVMAAGVSYWDLVGSAASLFGEMGALGSAFLGSFALLFRARAVGVRSSPTLALRGSLRNFAAIFIAGVTPFFFMLVKFIAVRRKAPSQISDIDTWIAVPLLLTWIFFFVALEKGGYFLLDHFATHFPLCLKKLIPWDLVRFLDTASERIFLRRVGGGYIFVHRSLMEYFANQFDETRRQGISSGQCAQQRAVARV